MAKKRVGLILGGLSSEREVSLNTGAAFAKALKKLDYPFVEIGAGVDFPEKVSQAKIDCALLALHGKYGEDGTVQGILEYLKIPYTGSGVLASALAMNKIMTKQVLTHWGVPTPVFQMVDLKGRSQDEIKEHIQNFKAQIPAPFVIKPAQEGSTVGVSVLQAEDPTTEEISEALYKAAQYDKMILVEKFVPGKEITVPVWMGRALPIIEIKPKTEFYDYQRKYTPGMTEYVIPAPLSPTLHGLCETYALETFRAVGCRHYARVDMRVTPEGNPYVLEINTLPGCTATSLFPKSAAQIGLSFETLIETLVEQATLDYL